MISFSTVESMLKDLEHDREVVDCVRIDTRSADVNSGATSHTFFVSYLVDDEVHHVAESCGCDFAGAEQEGTARVQELADMVASKCEEWKIPVRHGMYECS